MPHVFGIRSALRGSLNVCRVDAVWEHVSKWAWRCQSLPTRSAALLTSSQSSSASSGPGCCDITHSDAFWLASLWSRGGVVLAAYSEKCIERGKMREDQGRGSVRGRGSRKDWCWGKPALRNTHTHTHTQICSVSWVFSHHTPQLLNSREKQSLTESAACYCRTGQRTAGRGEGSLRVGLLLLCITSGRQLLCCHLWRS